MDLSRLTTDELFERLRDPEAEARKTEEIIDHMALMTGGRLMILEAERSGYGLTREDRNKAEEMIARGAEYLESAGLLQKVPE